MRKIYMFLFCCFLCSFNANTQASFNDDFESYNVGDYIGSQSSTWTTWSGSTGNAEDVRVTDNNALSGNQSIYFSSTAANGGPQDVVLPFGAKYSTGVFDLSLNVYVESGAGAYWNFQGETAIGTTWAHNCYFLATGELQFSNSDNGLALATSYNQGEWVQIAYSIDLDKNSWQISVNGECLGSFSNGFNAVASMDIFPLNGNKFYVDDIAFNYEPISTQNTYDASLAVNALDAGGLTGMEQQISGKLTNIGTSMITSAELILTTNNGETPYLLDNLNLVSGAEYEFALSDLYALVDGSNPVSLEVRKINSTETDENPCNSKYAAQLLGVTPADGKNIVVEEGTGTWCGWCPRGAVFLDRLTTKYGDRFIGIAIHNGDPMVVSGYDGQLGFTGYPGATVMRSSADTGFGSLADLELPFLEYIAQEPKATFTIGADIDSDRNLNISLDVSANVELTSGSKIAIIITEDGVTGTASGYAQANYYSGGGQGEMGGYESLPSTIPASQMVYDHVARAIPLGFTGDAESFTNPLTAGANRIFNYAYTVPAEYDVSKMHIIAVLINSNGTLDNGQSSSVDDAIANGFLVGAPNVLVDNTSINIYPNPSSDILNVDISLEQALSVNTSIYSVMGQLQTTQTYPLIKGLNTLSFNISDLATGNYYLLIENEGKRNVIQFIKE